MVFDTDVIIWALRGNDKAANLFNETEDREISIITYMEILRGSKNKKDLKLNKHFLNALDLQSIPLSDNIGHRASIYIEEYGLQTSFSVADALTAATVVENHLTLCTGNVKHFKRIADLDIKGFRP